MCGFAGFTGEPNPLLLERMDAAIFRRGPDQSGQLQEKTLSFTHRRLAIIDLSEAGRQPMQTTDGRFTVVYNGEIYNYHELRERYAKEGWIFQTKTDTECLLASAALHGLQDLASMRGIFAFVLWDRQENCLWIARDRQGVKPLYTTETPDGLAFSSEIPGLLSVKPHWTLNEAARAAYFTLGYVPGPMTLFTGIESVQPGTLFRYAIEEKTWQKKQSFLDVPAQESPFSHEEALSLIRDLVPSAVQEQLISDRPVGFFLSGGLDSSVILAQARRFSPNGLLKTYTTRFRSRVDEEKFNVDAESAKKTAQFFETDHCEIEVGAEEVARSAARLARIVAQPSLNTTMVALDAVAERASQDVAVALSGAGGDEVFAGYERHRRTRFVEPWLAIAPVRSLLRYVLAKKTAWQDLFAGRTELERYFSYHVLPRSARTELFGAQNKADEQLMPRWQEELGAFSHTTPLRRALAFDRRTWLQEDDLTRVDRLTMSHGLEVRVPWLDDRLVQASMRMKDASLVTLHKNKRVIREAFQAELPPHVLQAEKRAWMTPIAKWIRAELHDWAYAVLQEATHEHAWLHREQLLHLWEEHQARRGYYILELWTVIAYQLWWREYRAQFQGI